MKKYYVEKPNEKISPDEITHLTFKEVCEECMYELQTKLSKLSEEEMIKYFENQLDIQIHKV
jgi:hypothetical protein